MRKQMMIARTKQQEFIQMSKQKRKLKTVKAIEKKSVKIQTKIALH